MRQPPRPNTGMLSRLSLFSGGGAHRTIGKGRVGIPYAPPGR